MTVSRTTDGGESWHSLRKGLPNNCYTGVLRKALCTDQCTETGIYFGTANGQVFHSNNRGEDWHSIPATLPRIFSVSAITSV